MSRLLIILSMLLKIATSYIDLFEAGWRIEIYGMIHPDGRHELKSVKHWWSRFLRGIRYCRGTEGVPEPVCDECNHTVEEHELLCPEVEEIKCSEDSDGNDGPSSSCGKEPSSAASSTE